MRKWIAKTLGVALVAASFTAGWVLLELQSFLRSPLASGGQAVPYEVAAGSGLITVARDLQRLGLLEHPNFLVWYARWRGDAGRWQSGGRRMTPE